MAITSITAYAEVSWERMSNAVEKATPFAFAGIAGRPGGLTTLNRDGI